MGNDYLNILVFAQEASAPRRWRVSKDVFKIGFYLLALVLLFTVFFFCDYIQVKKKTFHLNRLRQESQIQRSQIQFFSAQIESLETQLSKLKEADRRIRITANLERGQEKTPFIGMGGSYAASSQGFPPK